MAENRVVFIIDDDPSVCESLASLLASMEIRTQSFGSARAYLDARKPDGISCLLLDMKLPDGSGLELQQKLIRGEHPPIIFITGYADISSSVQAIQAGAIDFLPKPFSTDDLIRAIREAFARDAEARRARAERTELRLRYARLTPREREVLPLIVAGLPNKQAASELGISHVTCQVHRGQIMRKMAAGSLAELVRMAEMLDIPIPRSAENAEPLTEKSAV